MFSADIALAKRALESDAKGAGEQQTAQLDRQLADIVRAEVKHKHNLRQQRAFQKNMMAQAVGKLYAEKENVKLDEKGDEAALPSTAGFVFRLRRWGAALVQRVVSSVFATLRSLTCVANQQKHIKTA